MRWPIGYVALDSVIESWEPERAINMLVEQGFAAVDWSFVQFDAVDQSASRFSELVRRSRDAGLEVSQLVMSDDLITLDTLAWNERIEHTLRAIDAAAAGQVATVGVSSGPHGWNKQALRIGIDLDEKQAFDLAASGLDRITAHAEAAGVRIGFESVWGSLADNGQMTQRLLDAIPRMGITFDPSHLVLPGDDIVSLAHQWADRIVHVHLKDAFGSRGVSHKDFFFPLLGEGEVPWQRLLTVLNEDGYEGYACIEAESYSLLSQCFDDDPTDPARLSLTLANKLYDLAGL